MQVGGSHYKDCPIQPIDYVLKNGLGFCEGNVVKYVTRWKAKGGVEDLRKARHYLDMLIESLAEPTQVSDWVEWQGGRCPVPMTCRIRAKWRNGHEEERLACEWCWEHFGRGDDIVAYRVMP